MSNESNDFGGFTHFDDPPEEKLMLTWHTDESDCFSNWTIIVETEGSDDIGTSYHCHQNVIAGGARRLEYFSTLLKNDSFSENRRNESKLVMKQSAVTAFPSLLNFVYHGTFKATTENVVPLFYLAQYLRCRELDKATTAFMEKDICTEYNAVVYVKEACVYSLEKLLAVALKKTAQSLLEFRCLSLSTTTTAPGCARYVTYEMKELEAPINLICKFSVPLFLEIWKIIEQYANDKKYWKVYYSGKSYAICRVVSEYCSRNLHNEEVNAEFISRVANPTMMPSLDCGTALKMLNCVFRYPQAGNEWILQGKKKPNNVLASLQERCIEGISKHLATAPYYSGRSKKFNLKNDIEGVLAFLMSETKKNSNGSNKKRRISQISNGNNNNNNGYSGNNDSRMKILNSCLFNIINEKNKDMKSKLAYHQKKARLEMKLMLDQEATKLKKLNERITADSKRMKVMYSKLSDLNSKNRGFLFSRRRVNEYFRKQMTSLYPLLTDDQKKVFQEQMRMCIYPNLTPAGKKNLDTVFRTNKQSSVKK